MSYSARKPDNYNSRFFWIAHISGDGRDLAILTTSNRVLLYQDFERIRRGEIGPVAAGRVLRLLPGTRCLSLAFEQRRLCIATVRVFIRISRYLHSCPPPPSPLFPAASCALHLQPRGRSESFHRPGKSRGRATLLTLGSYAESRVQLHAAHRQTHLLYVGRREASGRSTVQRRGRY